MKDYLNVVGVKDVTEHDEDVVDDFYDWDEDDDADYRNLTIENNSFKKRTIRWWWWCWQTNL